MCGICGQIAFTDPEEIDVSLVKRMMNTIHHRGPDDDGIYVGSGAVLGHKRLSIIDLSTGKQPISNEDNTVWVVFNGEIYNFRELRTELQTRGHVFRTQTDTEVIVHLYEEYREGCVEKLRGMFAFAIWDERHRTLLLARDRVGIKPLYYSVSSRRLLFGSEIKALLADKDVRRGIDPEGIDRFLTFMYMPGEQTLLRDVLKLDAGHFLLAKAGKVTIKQYWDLKFTENSPKRDMESAASELTTLLHETVRDHMISDVPVGVLLSGGVDSTALLSFVVEASPKEVETFTVGFDEKQVADERPYAKLAARTFGSKHREMTISPQDFLDFLPKYVWHMEEPVCEPPAVALYYVSKLASQSVKVLLSGEGGDEAFAGYQNYRNLMWLEKVKQLGQPLTGALAPLLESLGRVRGFERLSKYSRLINIPLEEYYYGRTGNPHLSALSRIGSLGTSDTSALNGSTRLIRNLFRNVAGESALNRMLYIDSKTWLPDDLLVKADKMTMANSVELRVPFLDHRVLEFAAGLPENAKVRGLTTKYLLKRAFHQRIPKAIINRPKTGFPVPYATWFRGELREPVMDILQDRRTRERGYFEPRIVARMLTDLQTQGHRAAEVFSLLTLELWHRQFADQLN